MSNFKTARYNFEKKVMYLMHEQETIYNYYAYPIKIAGFKPAISMWRGQERYQGITLVKSPK
jgi:hypothetical protein